MTRNPVLHKVGDIEFTIIFSSRKSISIGIQPDSSVIVRVPLRASINSIEAIIEKRADWIRKHTKQVAERAGNSHGVSYSEGGVHLYRGESYTLRISRSPRIFVRFSDNNVEMGIDKDYNDATLKRILYAKYRHEASVLFPKMLLNIIERHDDQGFRISGLTVRTMKSRWGSCSSKGKITLNTELIKLADKYIEYVMIHELCHLKHHNHGPGFYALMTELCPDWKRLRNELKSYIIH